MVVFLGMQAGHASAEPLNRDTALAWRDQARWRLLALEYARSGSVPTRRLIRNAPAGERIPMSWYFFAALGHGRILLVDAGTNAFVRGNRRELRQRWDVEAAHSIEHVLSRIGLVPADVTDVIVTHHHWDHVGGLESMMNARVFAVPEEWARVTRRLRRAVVERGQLLDARRIGEETLPGVDVIISGRHTRHHLTVYVRCEEKTIALAGDAAYTYRNVLEGNAVTATHDPRGNVSDVARMVERVGLGNVVPGHDPLVFERYPSPVSGVAVLCR